MTSLDVTEPETKRKIPKAPEDRPLPARNCCTLCLYNIPSGSLMILIPGLVLLLTGIVVMSWTKNDSSWNGDLTNVSLIFLIIGAGLVTGALIFWCTMWFKYRPKVTNKRRTVSPRGKQTVQLVAIHDSRHRQADIYYPPAPEDRIATIT
jgi:uncharacterized membrane protein YciS (DUF1049 family)